MNIAIITGASSGMGRELALQLSGELHKTDEIWLLARRKKALEELTEQMQIKAKAIAIDITDDRQLVQFAEVLELSNVKITLLANCAGTGWNGEFAKQSKEQIEEMVKLNVIALSNMTKLCLPYMKKGSRILFYASGAAFVPQAGFAVYAASKAYVYFLGRAVERELKKRNIKVMTVCPGPVNTPFLEHAYGKYKSISKLKKLTMAEPLDVTKKVIQDCKKNKTVSVYGVWMQMLYRITQSIENIMQLFI